jgi:hypothetical protein
MWTVRLAHLFQEVGSKHQNFSVRTEALDRTQIPNPFLVVLWRGHDLEDMKGGPRHVVAEHFKIDELQQGRCLDI